MSSKNKAGNLITLQQKGGPPIMIKRSVANIIVNALQNLKVHVPQTDGLGIQNVKDAIVVLGELGLDITMPPVYNTTGGAIGGGGGSGLVQQLSIVSDGGDWWICSDGTNTWYVIKPYKIRCGPNGLSGQTIRSISYTYTYTPVYISGGSGPVSYYTRTVKVSGTTIETDYVIPDPIAGDVIYAIGCTTPILTSNAPPANPSGGQLIDINSDGRYWGQ